MLLTGTHGPRLSQRASAALQPPALDRGSEGVEMVSSRQPLPESLPSAAISELTEPLEQPLGPLMTTEGPFTQGSCREEGSPCQSLSEPNPGLWPQDPKVAQHGDSSEGGKKKQEAGPTLASEQGSTMLEDPCPPPSSPRPSRPTCWPGAVFPLPLQPGLPRAKGSVWMDEQLPETVLKIASKGAFSSRCS